MIIALHTAMIPKNTNVLFRDFVLPVKNENILSNELKSKLFIKTTISVLLIHNIIYFTITTIKVIMGDKSKYV